MIQDIFLVLTFIIIILVVSGVTAEFGTLPVDIFNTSTGILIAFVFTQDSILLDATTIIDDGYVQADISSIKVFLIISQLAIGALVLSSYKAFNRTKEKYNKRDLSIKHLGYLVPMNLSVFSLYIWSTIYINRYDIFTPIKIDKPDLLQIMNNFFDIQSISLIWFIIIFLIITIFSIIYTLFRLDKEKTHFCLIKRTLK